MYLESSYTPYRRNSSCLNKFAKFLKNLKKEKQFNKQKNKKDWVCTVEPIINTWILSRYKARTQRNSKTKENNNKLRILYLAKLSLNVKIYFSDKDKLLIINLSYVHTKEKNLSCQELRINWLKWWIIIIDNMFISSNYIVPLFEYESFVKNIVPWGDLWWFDRA